MPSILTIMLRPCGVDFVVRSARDYRVMVCVQARVSLTGRNSSSVIALAIAYLNIF